MTCTGWLPFVDAATGKHYDGQLAYLEKLRAEGRLYMSFVVPSNIPDCWPNDAYSGNASLEPDQVDRPTP